MDRLEAMALLIETSERGSMSAASRSLGVPLPTLSRKLAELEARLGVRLLNRTTRRLSLTQAGTSYLRAARRIVEEAENAEREARGELSEPKGELTVTAPLLFGQMHLLPVLTDFLAAFPSIDVHMALSDRNARFIEEPVDVAIRIGALREKELIATALGRMRVVVCASPDLVRFHGRPGSPAELDRLPRVTLATPAPMPSWSFETRGTGTPARPRLTVTTAAAAVEAARRGVGAVQLLHYQVAGAVADGALEILLPDHEPPSVPVSAVHVAQGRMPLKLRSFLDYAVPRLRRDLRALETATVDLEPSKSGLPTRRGATSPP